MLTTLTFAEIVGGFESSAAAFAGDVPGALPVEPSCSNSSPEAPAPKAEKTTEAARMATRPFQSVTLQSTLHLETCRKLAVLRLIGCIGFLVLGQTSDLGTSSRMLMFTPDQSKGL